MICLTEKENLNLARLLVALFSDEKFQTSAYIELIGTLFYNLVHVYSEVCHLTFHKAYFQK